MNFEKEIKKESLKVIMLKCDCCDRLTGVTDEVNKNFSQEEIKEYLNKKATCCYSPHIDFVDQDENNDYINVVEKKQNYLDILNTINKR